MENNNHQEFIDDFCQWMEEMTARIEARAELEKKRMTEYADMYDKLMRQNEKTAAILWDAYQSNYENIPENA